MTVTENTLSQFNNDLTHILKDNYYDLVLHGSLVLNDFIPGKGDIDFIVLTNNELVKEEIDLLVKLHTSYKTQKSVLYVYQLEGTYYQKEIMVNPYLKRRGLYIGTKINGWKEINTFVNSYIDLLAIKEKGRSYLCKDVEIYIPSKDEIKNEMIVNLDKWKKLIDNDKVPLHPMIQWAARAVCFVKMGCVISKKESCILLGKEMALGEIERCGSIKYPYKGNIIERNEKNIVLVNKVFEHTAEIIASY